MRPATVCVVMLTLLIAGCAAKGPKAASPSIAPADCPAVLLTRTGGLGFETQGGVLAAVWPSGTIIRAEGPSLPARYLIGHLSAADVAALRELAESSKTWEQPLGKAVLEMPDDVLTLRRGKEMRQFSETPGFTTSPNVADFRARLFSVPVEKAKRFDESLKDIFNCANAQ